MLILTNAYIKGNFAVAITKDLSGNYIGQRSSMFSYSKLWLVSLERYEELVIEIATKWDVDHKKKNWLLSFRQQTQMRHKIEIIWYDSLWISST